MALFAIMAWVTDIQGNFRLHSAVVDGAISFSPPGDSQISNSACVVAVMPAGTNVLEAEAWGTSAWTKTAKITTLLPDGTPKRYFVKVRSAGTNEYVPNRKKPSCLTFYSARRES